MTPEELIAEYTLIHAKSGVMDGNSTRKRRDEIWGFINRVKPQTVLDYGCGKAGHYLRSELHKFWGIEMPTLYDPAVEGFMEKPQGKFDAVICVDVMEHIHPSEVLKTLDEVMNYSKAVFFNIATKPALKSFKNGTNFHTTIKPRGWWRAEIDKRSNNHNIEIYFDEEKEPRRKT